MPNTLSGSGNELPPPRSESSGEGETARSDSRSRLLPFLQWTRRTALKLGGSANSAPGSVAALMRAEPLISPFEPLAGAHAALRKSPNGALCVGVPGHVFGILTLDILNRVLASNLKYLGGPESSPALKPLSVLLDGPEPLLTLDAAPVLRSNDPLNSAQAALAAHPDAPLAVVFRAAGEQAAYLGVVYRSDIVASALGNLAPARIGGMATPLGVYLTDGVVQGGAGNLGLVLTGASMSTLYAVALTLSSLGFDWLERTLHFSLEKVLALSFLSLRPETIGTLAADLRVTLALPLVLILLRLIPVAGYHAAEHQVVHCLERGEPLIPENVRRMPRVHPRCGTNLVVGLSILTLAVSIGFGLTGSIAEAVICAVIVTLLTWRQVGSAAQQYLTTRPATDKQIASGIAAGQEVMRRSLESGLESRPTIVQRVWNMGLIQLMAGAYLVAALFQLVSMLFPATAPYLGGLD